MSTTWGESTDFQAIIPFKPIDFIRSLVGVDTLRLQYTQYRGGDAVATFAVTGADSAVTEIASACNWRI